MMETENKLEQILKHIGASDACMCMLSHSVMSDSLRPHGL